MKTILLSSAVLLVSISLCAQTGKSPFAKLGYKKQMMYTSSKGEFEEFHDRTNVVEIGAVLFNTKTKQVVGFVSEEKTEVSAATPAMSIDPLCEKYYWISPYAYCLNNPINMIDPDGRDAIYVAYPQYRANGIPFTGHAGVLLIDNKTGYTKYYEYGRYDKENKGIVRTVSVSNVVIGEDGRPTTESLNKVMKQLSDKSGNGGKIEGAYIISDKFKEMNDYAKGKMSENSDPDRKPYTILGNNCATFAEDVITQDKSVDKPSSVINSPTNIVDEYQEEGNARVRYNPKTNTTTIGKGNEKDAKIKIND